MLGPTWRSHFNVAQFSLKHDRPLTFIVSQWQHDKTTPNLKYLVLRTCIFIFVFVSWIFSFITTDDIVRSDKWPIYLTNWGFTVINVQALLVTLMLAVTLLAEFRPRVYYHWREKALNLYPVYWVLNTIASPVAFTITAMYWGIIYNAEQARFDAQNFLVHGSNSIVMLLDLWLVSHPIRILHFVYPLLLSVVYTIFTLIYFFAGGTGKNNSKYIYPILKWDDPGSTTLTCLGVMAFLLFLHLFSYFMYQMRTKVYEILFLPKMAIPPKSPPHNSTTTNSSAQTGYVNNAMTQETV